jgi:hypothetical protein
MKIFYLVLAGLWLVATVVTLPRLIGSYRRHVYSSAYYFFQLFTWLFAGIVIAGRFLPPGSELESFWEGLELVFCAATLIAMWKKGSEAEPGGTATAVRRES